MTHAAGQSRYRATLFPEVLDEIIPGDCQAWRLPSLAIAKPGDCQVRVIDVFVDTLDLAELGFSKVAAAETGRPPDAPGDLLKLYVYGYLNRVRSSRRLAAEAVRNVEAMWLINQLTPAFKTIADFRKDHAAAIVRVCRAFIEFCRKQAPFGAALLALDGTKIAAVASRKRVITPERIAKQNAAIDRKISDRLAAMDEADRQEPARVDGAAAIAALKAQPGTLVSQARELAARGLKQLATTEPEAKPMGTSHGHRVAYNAQALQPHPA